MNEIAYYNDINEYCCQWAQNLVDNGHVSNGVVDNRSIQDVDAVDLAEFTRVHLFSGILGWEYALRLAGWPDDEPVWTGSCPCQPFSKCGKQDGKNDPRHLWPEMFRLVAANRPPILFGEQVSGKRGLDWFDGVRTDLESLYYSCGMAVLPAACVGAPHKRERIFWVADASWTPRDGTLLRGDARAHRRVTGEEWGAYRTYRCSDGQVRRVGSGVQPLDARVPGDLGRLLAYGNAIVPAVAALFIRAYMEAKRPQ